MNRPTSLRNAVRVSTPRSAAGFTLVECLVVICIVAILASIAVPSYRYLMTTQRMSADLSALVGDMQFARSAAMKDGRFVSICPSNDGATCSSSNQWQSGWIIYSNPHLGATLDSASSILRVQQALSGPETLDSGTQVSPISFNRQGYANGLGGDVSIAVRDSGGNSSLTRCMSLSVIGQLSTRSYGAGTCS